MQLTEAVATVVKFDLELATPGALDDAGSVTALEGKLRETLSCFAGCDLNVAVDGATVKVEAIAREDIGGGASAAAALRAGADKVETTSSAAALGAALGVAFAAVPAAVSVRSGVTIDAVVPMPAPPPPACPGENPGYRDASGNGCVAWEGAICTSAAEVYGFTEEQVTELLEACPLCCAATWQQPPGAPPGSPPPLERPAWLVPVIALAVLVCCCLAMIGGCCFLVKRRRDTKAAQKAIKYQTIARMKLGEISGSLKGSAKNLNTSGLTANPSRGAAAASAGVAAHLQSKGKGKKLSSGKMAFASPAPLGGKHLGGLHSFKMDSTTIEPTLRPSVLSDPDRDLGDDPSRWEEPSMIAGTAEPKRAAREGSVLTNQI